MVSIIHYTTRYGLERGIHFQIKEDKKIYTTQPISCLEQKPLSRFRTLFKNDFLNCQHPYTARYGQNMEFTPNKPFHA